MADFPVLETERLMLRPPQGSDFEGMCRMWFDPAVMKHIGDGKPFTRQHAWERMLRAVGHWHVNGYGPWAVIEKATGQLVGNIGYLHLKRDLEPSIDEFPEMGWMLTAASQGKGFAAEALRAALAWGRTHFDNPKTVCILDPSNVASLKLAEKLGFRTVHVTTYNGHPTHIMERPTQGL